MYRKLKPKLANDEQILHLQNKGINFSIGSVETAKTYLDQNSNFFKLTSYRKNFAKHPDGVHKNKYIDLDFEMLKDLAIIDMRIRYTLLHMALDIEHYAKVRLLKVIENSPEDGYQIVEDYISSLDPDQQKRLHAELDNNRNSPYCKDIVLKYDNNFPIWAFVEVITFGRFVYFYLFCADRFNDKALKNEGYLLISTKLFRNAVAHNNCLINDLSPNTSIHKTRYEISKALGKIGFSKEIHSKKMSNVRIQQMVTLFYTHKLLVTSTGIHNHQCDALSALVDRIFRNYDYYSTNGTISTTFNFLKLVIDNWFPNE